MRCGRVGRVRVELGVEECPSLYLVTFPAKYDLLSSRRVLWPSPSFDAHSLLASRDKPPPTLLTSDAGLNTVVSDNWKPQALITGKYGSKDLQIGQAQSKADVANFPSLFVNPAPGQDAFKPENLYSALLVDAGPVGANEQTLHWLINTIHVNTTTGTGGPWAINYTDGTTITEYAGPAPPAGSGPHRYAFLLVQQNQDFAAPQAYSQKNTPVGAFDYKKYITDAKLGQIVAANYFTVEEGTATATLSQTQAVDTASISGYTGAAAIPTAVGSNNGTAGAAGAGGVVSTLTDANGSVTGTTTIPASGTSAPAGASGVSASGASAASGAASGASGAASGASGAASSAASAAPGGGNSAAGNIGAPLAAVGGAVVAALALF